MKNAYNYERTSPSLAGERKAVVVVDVAVLLLEDTVRRRIERERFETRPIGESRKAKHDRN